MGDISSQNEEKKVSSKANYTFRNFSSTIQIRISLRGIQISHTVCANLHCTKWLQKLKCFPYQGYFIHEVQNHPCIYAKMNYLIWTYELRQIYKWSLISNSFLLVPISKGKGKLTKQWEITNFNVKDLSTIRGSEMILKSGMLIQHTVTTLLFSGSDTFLDVFLSSSWIRNVRASVCAPWVSIYETQIGGK